MNVFAKFDEIPSVILEVIKETKRYTHTFVRSDGRSVGQWKTVYPPINTVCRGGGGGIMFFSFLSNLINLHLT